MMYDHPPAPIVVCHDCTQAEKDTLKFLQNRGIRNINALATVMGNIKQESKFDHLICAVSYTHLTLPTICSV